LWETIFGTAIAALLVGLITAGWSQYKRRKDTATIYSWLKANTSPTEGPIFRSTRAIASHCNLTESEVVSLCSKSKKIYQSTGTKEDMWSIYERRPKGTFG
jgi:hypothetical protein